MPGYSKHESSGRSRDDFIAQIREGLITPDEAEELVTKQGWPSLFPESDEAMEEPIWGHPTTLAWIMTRDVDVVRATWDKDEFWSSARSQGRIRKFGPPDLSDLEVWQSSWKVRNKLALDLPNASKLLHRALRAGTIQAYGLPSKGNHTRVSIPAYEWRDLILYVDLQGIVARAGSRSGAGYDDITFDSTAVRKVWPASIGKRECYVLPAVEPRGEKPRQAYRALKRKYPDNRVPKKPSVEALIAPLNRILIAMGHGPTNRDAVLRALGKKKPPTKIGQLGNRLGKRKT